MPRTIIHDVDGYIAAQPKNVQPALKQVRQAIRKAVPKAIEEISYKIPAYRMPNGGILYFAGWSRHYSLYPAGARLVSAFERELAGYTAEKSTIRFPFSEPVPVRLIERIARFRANEGDEGASTKPKKRRTAKKAALGIKKQKSH